jgi:hypothetical protein
MNARGVPPMTSSAMAISKKKASAGTILAVVAVLLFIAVAVWIIAAYALPDEVADAGADKRGGTASIVAAKTAIATRLPDAQSLAYGKVFVLWTAEAPVVCGTVDVEEPQDSFDGPERFVYLDGQVLLEELDGSAAVNQRWADACD